MRSLSHFTMNHVSVLVSQEVIDGSLRQVMAIEANSLTNLAERRDSTGKRSVNAMLIPVMAQGSMSRANLLPVVEWAPVLRASKRAALSPHRGSGFYSQTQLLDRAQETFAFAVNTVEEFVKAVGYMKPDQRPHYQIADLQEFWDSYPGSSMVVVCFGQNTSGPETVRVAFWYRPQFPDSIMVPTAHGSISNEVDGSKTSGIATAVIFGGTLLGDSVGEAVDIQELEKTSFPRPSRVIGEAVTGVRASDDLYYRAEKLQLGLLENTPHPAPNRKTSFFVRRPIPSVKVLPVERIG